MNGFLWKIQSSVSNILMKNLFWKESKTNWIGIHIQFQQSIQKNIRKPSLLPTTTELRKPPKLWWIIHQPDELKDFLSADTIQDFNRLEEIKFFLNGFELKKKKMEDHILIYRIVFDPETHFPSIKECICIDRNLHIRFQCDGNPIPLPQKFIYGHNAKLARFSMLENFPNYIQNEVEEHAHSILRVAKKAILMNKKVVLHLLQS